MQIKKFLLLFLTFFFILGISLALYVFVPRELTFSIDLPEGFEMDFSNSENYILANNKDTNFSIHISEDHSPYEDTFEYIEYYQNRFYVNENYLNENNIILHENRYTYINNYKTSILTLTKDYETLADTTYTYAFIQTSGQFYTRFMFKSNMTFDDNYIEMYEKILASYKPVVNSFRSTIIYYSNKVVKKLFHVENFFKEYKTNTIPVKALENSKWNEKTKALYNTFKNQNNILWGLFIKNIHGDAISTTIPELEEKLEHKFEIMLVYNHLGKPLPLEAMKKMKEENRIIEFTYQTCVKNNEVMYGYTPMFDIIEGKYDEEFRILARQLKSFENPILFRLNNEMNSDWTSYAGIISLSDPDIYISVWHRIYNIFEEENVDNCIWIFNPNDNNYPPSKWNNFISYYPGNEYVQMMGITGYNTGTYYAEKLGERWREFKEIYDTIDSKYERYFSDFPWIITEFACSSMGGDKSKWITDMFEDIQNHKNIKAAIWFSGADYNPENGELSRSYFLDETPETIKAFRDGLKNKKNENTL